MSFGLSSLFLVLIYAAIGISAGTVQRSMGLISIAHGAVAGVGAYAYAITTTVSGGIGSGYLVAVLAGSAFGIGITALAGRVRGISYALATFGIQIIWLGLASNLEVFGGAFGIPGIPGQDTSILVLLGAILLFASILFFNRLHGTALAAAYAVLSRSTELGRAMGLPIWTLLALVGSLYGGILGIAGAMLAAHLSFIDSTVFGISVAVTVLSIGFFTAEGGTKGGFLGALLIVGFPQVLRLLGLSTSAAGYIQAMMSGLALFGITIVWLKRRRTT